jgi:serine/threonine protein kinase
VRALLKIYPEGAAKKGKDGKLPIHNACAKGSGASAELVFALLAACPEAARAKNDWGNLALHDACFSGAPLAVVRALLELYPEGAAEKGADGTLALQVAYAKSSTEFISILLCATITLDVSSLDFDWRDAWVSFLHSTGDKYLAAIEAALDAHAAHIEAIASATDSLGRSALGVAVGPVRELIQSRLYLLGRFELAAGPPEHASATSVVRFATDHSVEPPARVALKFMLSREAFERELLARRLAEGRVCGSAALAASPIAASAPSIASLSSPSAAAEPTSVLPIFASFDGETDATARSALAARGFSSHPFVLALLAADRSLAAVIDHERALPSWPVNCLHAARQLAAALAALHARGLVHGDVKPRNAVRIGTTIALIDMDAAAEAGAPVAPKASSAFAAPELVAALLAAMDSAGAVEGPEGSKERSAPAASGRGASGSSDAAAIAASGAGAAPAVAAPQPAPPPLAAAPSLDAWAFGATLFAMLTGATLLHADAADNAVGGRAALARLAEWSEASKAEALSRAPLSREARSLLSQLLQRDPARRPQLARALRHPYFTNRPAGRLPGEAPRFDAFVSYRVASDKDARAALVAALEARGLRVWSDAQLALASVGDPWRDPFCDALAASRVFVPIVSRGAVNAGAELPARHWPSLRANSALDNVLLEHRLALELGEHGLCEAVVPVLLGDEIALPVGRGGGASAVGSVGGERGDFFAQGCAPARLPSVTVASVEAELARQTDRLGLGAPLTGGLGVAEVWRRAVSDRQASVGAGQFADVIEAAADAVARAVALHAAGGAQQLLTAQQATQQAAQQGEAAAGAARRMAELEAMLAAALAERDARDVLLAAARAERDEARAERDAERAARRA